MGLFGSRQERGEGTDEKPAPATTDRDAAARRPDHSPSEGASPAGSTAPATASASDQPSRTRDSAPAAETQRAQGGKQVANVGQSIVFKGTLSGNEDLEIEGQVEGDVDLSDHQLTIGASAQIKAEVKAKSILVIGRVTGNLIASERVEIQATGVVEGDIKAPRLLVQEGAVLSGRIDMAGGGAAGTGKSPASGTPSEASGGEVRKSA
jgi:cytoskeletal protein CcmA (bactofilin family)